MLAASSDSRCRHGATLHDDAGREKSVGDGWHVTARLFRQLLTNRIERPRTLGEMKTSEKVNSSKWRAQSAFDWIGSRDGRSITWHHERLGFSTAVIQSPTFFSLPYVISIDFSPSLAFSDCLGRTGRKSAQCDVWSFFLNSARLSTFVHLSHSMHIIIPARNERWRSWACAVCVCVFCTALQSVAGSGDRVPVGNHSLKYKQTMLRLLCSLERREYFCFFFFPFHFNFCGL